MATREERLAALEQAIEAAALPEVRSSDELMRHELYRLNMRRWQVAEQADLEAALEQLRAAWLLRSPEGPEYERTRREQLALSVAPGSALAELVADLERSTCRTDVDFRVSGDGVLGNAVNARDLGQLVTRTATAVKELVKNATHLRRFSSNLELLAIRPGSVRFVLQEPPNPRLAQPSDMGNIETVEGQALRQLASLLQQAEQDASSRAPDDSVLTASLVHVGVPARRAVGSLARTVQNSGWTIKASVGRGFTKRGDFVLTPRGARQLVEATSTSRTESKTVVILGYVDGFSYSAATMDFKPSHGRLFSAAVPEPLHDEVTRRLAEDHERLIRAQFVEVTAYAEGGVGVVRRGYELLSMIEEQGPQLELDS
jgi:hypothetical protein